MRPLQCHLPTYLPRLEHLVDRCAVEGTKPKFLSLGEKGGAKLAQGHIAFTLAIKRKPSLMSFAGASSALTGFEKSPLIILLTAQTQP